MAPKIEFDYSKLAPNKRASCLEFKATITWPDRPDPKRAIIMVDCFDWFDALVAEEVDAETFESRREEIEAEVIRLFNKPEYPLQTPRNDRPGVYELIIPAPEPVA